jgi:membrane associated rhomboid family serine protease
VNFNIPPGTQLLILANVSIFLVEQLTGAYLWGWFALWPISSDFDSPFQVWQIATYGFLHADIWHLLFNMFAVFMFGSQIELLFGQRWYLSYFLVCILSAAVVHLAVGYLLNAPPYPTIGASGGVFGVLLAYAMYFPHRKVIIFPIPVPMSAWVMVAGYALLTLYFGVSGRAPGVAHFAHLGGMVGGYLMIRHRRGGRR